jgi:hypothetical protein
MIIGTTTTDGVTKVKTKTTDGVVKAVECACCNTACDPDALWGPGYDDQPSEIELFGYTLSRLNKCKWLTEECLCASDRIWLPQCAGSECDDQFGPYLSVEIGVNYYYPPISPGGPAYEGIGAVASFWALVPGSAYETVDGDAVRTGGDYPAPYGDYLVVSRVDDLVNTINRGDTITISP